MITSAICPGAASRVRRQASRSLRRARFRFTALRTCRLTANPTCRAVSDSRQSTIRDGRSIRWPFWKSAWKSAPRVNRWCRGSRPVRRSDVCAPSPAAASGFSARPASSSARGSRGSSPVGAGSAGTSVSSRVFSCRLLSRNSVGRGTGQVNAHGNPLHACDGVSACATLRGPADRPE